jgi:protein-tyrosine phosphatase
MSSVSLVRPNLYLGNFVSACNLPQLEALGISHIVNATAEVKNQFPERFSYHRVPVKDLPSETLLPHFTPISNFITVALEQGGKVLIHCQMGISRSATLMIAHLMLVERLELSVAYQEVRRVREIIRPIPAFLGHLRQLEQELFGEVRTKGKLSFLDAALVESEDSFEVLVVEYLTTCAARDSIGFGKPPSAELGHLLRKQRGLVVNAALEKVRDSSDGASVLANAIRRVFMDFGGRDERGKAARAALSDLICEALEGCVLPEVVIKQAWSQLLDSEAWQPPKLDVPLADEFARQLAAHCAGSITDLEPVLDWG